MATIAASRNEPYVLHQNTPTRISKESTSRFSKRNILLIVALLGILTVAAHFLLPLAGVALLDHSTILITGSAVGGAAFLVWLAFLMISKCCETSDSDQESYGSWNDPVADLCQRDGFTIDDCIGDGAWGKGV